jgi:ribonuclease HI
MEMTAVIEGLSALNRRCRVDLYTDSTYVMNAFKQGWLEKWKKNGWRTSDKMPVKNDDLWRKLQALIEAHEVTWHWVRGHAGNPENERADRLAVAARLELP